MGEEKGDFKVMAGVHVSLIKRSSKGRSYCIARMYSFSPKTTLGLIHTKPCSQ